MQQLQQKQSDFQSELTRKPLAETYPPDLTLVEFSRHFRDRQFLLGNRIAEVAMRPPEVLSSNVAHITNLLLDDLEHDLTLTIPDSVFWQGLIATFNSIGRDLVDLEREVAQGHFDI